MASLVGVVLGASLSASPALAEDTGWTIDDFKADISIRGDATRSIVETIQVDFVGLQKHGIFRDIPVVYDYDQRHYQVYRLAVESVTNAQGSPWKYSTSRNGGFEEIKIGDPNRTVTGPQTYRIRYTVRGAMTRSASFDELYWNVSGPNWPVPIRHASATVAAPAGSIEQVFCYEGTTGSTVSCRLEHTAESATFEATKAFAPGEQLTIDVGLKGGVVGPIAPILEAKPRSFLEYFELTPAPVGAGVLLLLGGLIGLGSLLWRRGRDHEYAGPYRSGTVAEERIRPLFRPEPIVPEYQPPDGLRPAQIGLILDERADTKDVTATIVDLAVRGYLVIRRVDRKFASDDWELERKRESDGSLQPYESLILNGLFSSGSPVYLKSLSGQFVGTLRSAERMLNVDAAGRRWFAANPQSVRLVWVGVGIVIIAAGVGLAWLLGSMAGWGLVGIALILVGVATILVNGWMPRRTGLGHQLFRKALGFRLYMTTAEKDRQAFAEKAELFTQYLPYAIVLGCVHRWARAFSGLDRAAASSNWSSWYVTSAAFDVNSFSSHLEDFSGHLGSAISSSPASSGGGGGGGFSGGGGGGGGGGSW
jgi:uncharacterized membrane protein YgcG